MKIIVALILATMTTACTPAASLSDNQKQIESALDYLHDTQAAIAEAVAADNSVENIAYAGVTGIVYVQPQKGQGRKVRLDYVARSFTSRKLHLNLVKLTTENPAVVMRRYTVRSDNGGSVRFRNLRNVGIPKEYMDDPNIIPVQQ